MPQPQAEAGAWPLLRASNTAAAGQKAAASASQASSSSTKQSDLEPCQTLALSY
jgi:hypothetical protein